MIKIMDWATVGTLDVDKAHDYHRRHHGPAVKSLIGHLQTSYNNYYIKEARALYPDALCGEAPLVEPPFHFLGAHMFDESAWSDVARILEGPQFSEMRKDESMFIDRRSNLRADFAEDVVVAEKSLCLSVGKIIFWSKIKPGANRAEALEHHRNVHRPLVAATMGALLHGYVTYDISRVQTMYADEVTGEPHAVDPPFDFLEVMTFETEVSRLEAYRILRGERGVPIRQGQSPFLDSGSIAVASKFDSNLIVPDLPVHSVGLFTW
jgi:EthD domain